MDHRRSRGGKAFCAIAKLMNMKHIKHRIILLIPIHTLYTRVNKAALFDVLKVIKRVAL